MPVKLLGVAAAIAWIALCRFLLGAEGTVQDPAGDGLAKRSVRAWANDGAAMSAFAIVALLITYGGALLIVRYVFKKASGGQTHV